MSFNPYKVLAVDPSADPDVISAAYRTLSKKYHPDLNKGPEAEERMREINRAYEMLKDPDHRRKVDDDMARQNSAGSRPSGFGSYNNPNSNPASPNRPAAQWPDVGEQFDNIRKRAEGVINNVRNTTQARPYVPTDKTLYFYQKTLEDEGQHKRLKVAVYHDGPSNRKICNVRASAPNSRGDINTGEVFLDSGATFDLTLAMSQAQRVLQDTSSPIEMNSDHDVYFRQVVHGLGRTYIAVEVVKKARSQAKEALLLIGEKNARTERDGVVSDQSPTKLQQVARVFQSALEAMR